MSFKFCLGTKNPNKVKEIHDILKDFNPEIILPVDRNFPDETGETFAENALIKALFVAQQYPCMYAVAEDSGLVVPALNGMPGIFSSRFAGPNANDRKNIEKLLKYLEDENNRQAYFVCTVALVSPSGERKFFEGRLYGVIARKPRGQSGFGYDPIFEIPEINKTLGEISSDEKNRISHRAKAFLQLAEYLSKAV